MSKIMGRKELTLFSPADTEFLYPNIHGELNLSQISLVVLDNPDHETFPIFKNAQPYKDVLDPGDILYIPLNWWPQVKSLDLSISIKYWWHRFELVDGLGIEGESTDEIKKIIRCF